MFHTIFLDVYGTLADFYTEAARQLQRNRFDLSHIHDGSPMDLTREMLERKWPPGVSFQKYLSNADGENIFKGREDELFWKCIRQDPMFWRRIQPYPWQQELCRLVHSHCQHVVLLTQLDWSPIAYSGVREWLVAHGLGDVELHTCSTHKWRLVSPNSLLIDDYDKHCHSWMDEHQRRYGCCGNALLFPSRSNANHAHTRDPMPFVRRYFNERTVNAV